MVNILLKGNAYSFLIIIGLSIVAWFIPTGKSSADYLFFGSVVPTYLALFIGYVINWIAALIFNSALSKHFFTNDNTIGFILFYLLICSLASGSPQLIGWSFLAFSLAVFMQLILSMKEVNMQVTNVFNAAFFLGVLCIVNIFFIPFLYLIILGIGSVRAVLVKDFFTIVLAILTPFYVVLGISYLTGKYTFIEAALQTAIYKPSISIGFVVANLVIFGFSLAGIFLFKKNRVAFGAKTIRVSNILTFLYVISVVLSFLGLFNEHQEVYFAWAAIANAVFITTLFLKIEFLYKDFILAGLVVFLLGIKFLI